MFLALILAGTMIGTVNTQFDNMDDEDFARYLQVHDDFRVRYGETAAKGCLTGGIGGAPGGFAALCIGCATGAAANVAQDVIFPEKKRN